MVKAPQRRREPAEEAWTDEALKVVELQGEPATTTDSEADTLPVALDRPTEEELDHQEAEMDAASAGSQSGEPADLDGTTEVSQESGNGLEQVPASGEQVQSVAVIDAPRETVPDAGAQADLPRQAETPVEPQWKVERKEGPDGLAGPPTEVPPGLRRQVLVIDDDLTMRMLLKMGLRPHGYDCLLAENGKVAQEVLQTSSPDLILVDLLMPVMDGLAFMQWLRQTAQNTTPVLVFTNVQDPKVTQEAFRCGANAFVCKPLHLRELLATMKQLVAA